MTGFAANTEESSLEGRLGDSRIAGEGDNEGLGGSSESDRVLFDLGVREPSSCSSCLVRFDLLSVAPIGAAMVVVDISCWLLHPVRSSLSTLRLYRNARTVLAMLKQDRHQTERHAGGHFWATSIQASCIYSGVLFHHSAGA